MDTCKNGHDVEAEGGRDNRGRCRACNRDASKRFVERRKAGIPIDPARQSPRRDLGYDKVENVKGWDAK